MDDDHTVQIKVIRYFHEIQDCIKHAVVCCCVRSNCIVLILCIPRWYSENVFFLAVKSYSSCLFFLWSSENIGKATSLTP